MTDLLDPQKNQQDAAVIARRHRKHAPEDRHTPAAQCDSELFVSRRINTSEKTRVPARPPSQALDALARS
jgi:hypothetical protein